MNLSDFIFRKSKINVINNTLTYSFYIYTLIRLKEVDYQ